jgi:hypothetical protein
MSEGHVDYQSLEACATLPLSARPRNATRLYLEGTTSLLVLHHSLHSRIEEHFTIQSRFIIYVLTPGVFLAIASIKTQNIRGVPFSYGFKLTPRSETRI